MARATDKPAPERAWFEVMVSFDGLDKGERFPQDAPDLGWALQHVATGYLRDVTEEVADAGRSEVGQG